MTILRGKDVLFLAPGVPGHTPLPTEAADQPIDDDAEMVGFVEGLSVAEVSALVENGTLKAEDVVAAEKKGKNRKMVLGLDAKASE